MEFTEQLKNDQRYASHDPMELAEFDVLTLLIEMSERIDALEERLNTHQHFDPFNMRIG